MTPRDWQNFFNEKDIDSFYVSHIDSVTRKSLDVDGTPEILEVLNRAVRKEIEKAPVVYGKANEMYDGDNNFHGIGPLVYVNQPEKSDTHTARLIAIEEIKHNEKEGGL